MAPRTRRNYNDEEIERGLVAMALHSANSTRAHASLKEQGLPISARTLYTWVHKTKTERYEQVRREVMPQIKEAAHAGHMASLPALTSSSTSSFNASRKTCQRFRPETYQGA